MDGGPLGFDFGRTVDRTTASTLIAAVFAIPLGIVLGSSERLYRSVEFVIDFFRSTPASAMFPLFLVLFGVGDETKISVAAFGAALVILFNVAYGVMNARQTRLLAAKVMGASGFASSWMSCCWSHCRRLSSACATASRLRWSSSSWRRCSSARRTGSATASSSCSNCLPCRGMYAAIFAAGALGYGLNLLFLLIERRFVHWSGK